MGKAKRVETEALPTDSGEATVADNVVIADPPEAITSVEIPPTIESSIGLYVAERGLDEGGWQLNLSRHVELNNLSDKAAKGLQRLFNGDLNMRRTYNGKLIMAKPDSLKALLERIADLPV